MKTPQSLENKVLRGFIRGGEREIRICDTNVFIFQSVPKIFSKHKRTLAKFYLFHYWK